MTTQLSPEAEAGREFMLAAHDAFRRDLGNLARAASYPSIRADQRPALTAGWTTFSRQLRIHHHTEDAALWPAMRNAARSDDERDLLDAMEAEHSVIDPLLDACDSVIAADDVDTARLADLSDELHLQLTGHLRHEETDALPLAGQLMTRETWGRLSSHARREQGMRGAAELFPWMLRDASGERAQAVLGSIPAPIRVIYRRRWVPKYRNVPRWV